jgi:hypothetical protein
MRRPGEQGSHDHSMRDDEERSFTRVVEGLGAAFPGVPSRVVREYVERIREKYANARVRTYLPILVAREARGMLSGVVTVDEPVGID